MISGFSIVLSIFGLGFFVGCCFAPPQVLEHPYIRVSRALLDIHYLYRREAQQVWAVWQTLSKYIPYEDVKAIVLKGIMQVATHAIMGSSAFTALVEI